MNESTSATIIKIMKGRMTQEECDDLLYKMDVLADRAEHKRVKDRHSRVFGSKLTLMITISFDKKMAPKETLGEMSKFMSSFKESNYKWLENGIYSHEFYSGTPTIWNPHIHIITEKNDSPSIIRKAVERSPAYKKTTAYNVNVKPGNDGYHYKYIQGDKKDSKEVNVIKDSQFREENNLKSHYIL